MTLPCSTVPTPCYPTIPSLSPPPFPHNPLSPTPPPPPHPIVLLIKPEIANMLAKPDTLMEKHLTKPNLRYISIDSSAIPSWTKNFIDTKAKWRHLEIQSVPMVYSALWTIAPRTFSLATLPLPVWISILYTRIQCIRGGNWDSGPQTEIHLPQSSFTGQFFRWRHFALPSTGLIFLRYAVCFLLHPVQCAKMCMHILLI